MDFSLGSEQQMIRDLAASFADEEVAPGAAQRDAEGRHPDDILAKMGELGMMGVPFPEAYGGSGGDWVSMHLLLEEIARADLAVAAALEVTSSVVGEELFAFGSEEQKKRWLTPIARGEIIGAFALTEPDAGSDAASLTTSAELVGGEWVINGTKQFITNAGLAGAGLILVAARLKEGGGPGPIATFIVPIDAPGLTLGRAYEKAAWRASATNPVIMEDCRVPRDNLLGDARRGFSQHLAALTTGRISLAAMSVGLAEACLREALAHALTRRQFGKSIHQFQAVSFPLADVAVSIELARNMYLKAAWKKDASLPHAFEASAAKLFASEMAEKAASRAVQVFGGYGQMMEYPVARLYQSAKLLQIVEGTSEVQRLIIARELAARGGF